MKIRIAAPANDNRANEALIEFLRRSLALPRSAVQIVQGAHSRRKIVVVAANDEATLGRLLALDRGCSV